MESIGRFEKLQSKATAGCATKATHRLNRYTEVANAEIIATVKCAKLHIYAIP